MLPGSSTCVSYAIFCFFYNMSLFYSVGGNTETEMAMVDMLENQVLLYDHDVCHVIQSANSVFYAGNGL